MNLRPISAVTTEPLTLAQVRLHLRLDASTDSPPSHPMDAWLSTAITAAREQCESFTGHALAVRSWEMRADRFADGIPLLPSPVRSIASVKYIDTAGIEQTLATDRWVFEDDIDQPRIRMAYGATWPDSRYESGAVRVRYEAGYTDGDSPNTNPMPSTIKAAMLLLIGGWYENPSSMVVGQAAAELPLGVQYLLRPHRVTAGF